MIPLLLSKRQAAKLLGIGRDTLAELVAGGHVRTVDCAGTVKISREECERFAREGCEGTGKAPTPPKAERAPRRPKGSALAESTRALVIE